MQISMDDSRLANLTELKAFLTSSKKMVLKNGKQLMKNINLLIRLLKDLNIKSFQEKKNTLF